jgi:hypothetical protein
MLMLFCGKTFHAATDEEMKNVVVSFKPSYYLTGRL